MEKTKAALKILYILSSIDGEVSGSELTMIMDFLQKIHGDIKFDYLKFVQPLLFLGKEDLHKEVKNSAAFYRENSTFEERIDLLEFAARLSVADGRFDIEEIRLFNILGEEWDIDIDKFMSELFK